MLRSLQMFRINEFNFVHLRKYLNIPYHQNLQGFARCYSSQNMKIDPADEPIKFSTSKACSYKAKVTRMGHEDTRLWYEPYIILGSLTVFLLYFCVFREENDIDKKLSTSLYTRIEGLEELQLKQSLTYNLENGLETSAIIQRLREIEKEKYDSTELAN